MHVDTGIANRFRLPRCLTTPEKMTKAISINQSLTQRQLRPHLLRLRGRLSLSQALIPEYRHLGKMSKRMKGWEETPMSRKADISCLRSHHSIVTSMRYLILTKNMNYTVATYHRFMSFPVRTSTKEWGRTSIEIPASSCNIMSRNIYDFF